jgi:hypothetical protein
MLLNSYLAIGLTFPKTGFLGVILTKTCHLSFSDYIIYEGCHGKASFFQYLWKIQIIRGYYGISNSSLHTPVIVLLRINGLRPPPSTVTVVT